MAPIEFDQLQGYPGRIVAYDEAGDYLIEIVVNGKTRNQKVKA